jgi:hypothetical protein
MSLGIKAVSKRRGILKVLLEANNIINNLVST